VKAIMDVHDGEVTVNSQAGRGSDFRLRFGLPASDSL
jgi:signal transduction histidine kinase